MLTKELVKDNYMKAQDAATSVDEYHLVDVYEGAVVGAVYYPVEKYGEQLQKILHRYYELTSLASIRKADLAAEDQLIIYRRYNAGVAALPRIVEEQRVEGYINLKPSETGSTSGSFKEEQAQSLRHLTERLVVVYPGFTVTRDDYERRFRGVDLDYYRQRMKPDVFRSFVKSMGTVRGVEGLSDRSLEEYEG